MEKEFEIRTSEKGRENFNMAPWCSEKSENILRKLIYLIEDIKNLDIPEEKKEELMVNIPIIESWKLFIFSNGVLTKGEISDTDLLWNEGISGLKKLMEKYGIIE